MKVYAIIERRSRTSGHGESTVEDVLETTGPYNSGPYAPCFRSAQDAMEWIVMNERHRCVIAQLELQ